MSKYYYMVIMHRKTKEVMIVLRCEHHHSPLNVLRTYAEWNGVEYKDLLYNRVRCADYNEVLEGKDMLESI